MATCTIAFKIANGAKTISVRYLRESVLNNPPASLWDAIASPPDLSSERGREAKYFKYFNHLWWVGNNHWVIDDDGVTKKLLSITLHTETLSVTEAARLQEALEKNDWGVLKS